VLLGVQSWGFNGQWSKEREGRGDVRERRMNGLCFLWGSRLWPCILLQRRCFSGRVSTVRVEDEEWGGRKNLLLFILGS